MIKPTLVGIEGLAIKSNINSFLKKPVKLLAEVTSAFEGNCARDNELHTLMLEETNDSA